MNISGNIFAAMLTPFSENEDLDLNRIAPLVDYILDSQVDGLYVGGSSGEGMLQNTQERSAVLKEVAACADRRCTLIAHVGATSTREATALAKVARDNNYAAISAVPPYYYKHSFAAIAEYYRTLADESGLPLIIYNIPVLSGNDISSEKLLELMQDSRIIGVKFTAPDLFQFAQMRIQAPDKSFYFGTDEMYLSAAAIGADGGIGSTYNLIGDFYVDIQKALDNGDLVAARTLQNKANSLVQILLETGVIPGLKHALNYLGVPVGVCRKPFLKPSSASVLKLEAWIKEHLNSSLNL